MPLAKDTELVAFGVGHDNPRLVTLANVDTLRAMSLKASHLGVLVIRPEVEMQPALTTWCVIGRSLAGVARRACRSLDSRRPHKIMNRCLIDHGLVRP